MYTYEIGKGIWEGESMNQNFYEAVEDNPIIAAVKSMEDVEECCKHDDIRVIFILFGDVCSIGSIVKTIRDAGKIAMVHMDLISGLSPKEIAVEFIKEQTEADGIISTKPSLIKKAKENVYVYSTPCFLTGFNGI